MPKTASPTPSLNDRTAGILLHLTSLPGAYGVGDMGGSAYDFVDILESIGHRYWQMLPLNPAGLGHSPYQAFSAFAGSSLLISPDELRKDGLLSDADLESIPAFPKGKVDYERVSKFKHRLLGLAFARFLNNKLPKEFSTFETDNVDWLEDFALFTALQQLQKGAPWMDWQDALRRRDPNALKEAKRNLEEKILFQKFVQFAFFRQWDKLKTYATAKNVALIGDLPIFVSLDSADVWAHPEFFQLEPNGRPRVVAGVPPDMFSKTGQRWGNPLYDWEILKKRKYAWWTQRFRRMFQCFDVVRLDHFIGFYRFWEIPANEMTAAQGRYVPGPGADFFKEIFKQLPKAAFIAEDLGVVIPEVTALRKQFNLPGMSVLQFAFSGDPEKNPYLPHRLDRETVVYTGTHDNDTTEGWFNAGISPAEQTFVQSYIGSTSSTVSWDLIRLAYKSVAHTAIIPMQDVLNLGSEARMNFPGKTDGNWSWRMESDALTQPRIFELGRLARTYGRTHH